MGISIEPPGPVDPVGAQSDLVNYGSVTAPAGGAAIATATTPPPGVYDIYVWAEISGTYTSADQDNIRLSINGSVIVFLPLQCLPATGQVQAPIVIRQRVTAGSVVIQARSAGGAAAVYACLMSLRLVG